MIIHMLGEFVGFKAGPGRTLVIHFSHRDTPPGKFSQYRALGEVLNYPILFLNVPHGSWYCDGIQPFGSDTEESVVGLKRFIEDGGYQQVVCVGFSMGGFGALLYGCRLEADLIVSFSPEAALRFFDNRSVEQRAGIESPDENVLPLLEKRSLPTHVFVGSEELCDLLQGSLIANRSSAEVHVIGGATHGTLAYLREKGRLTTLMEDLIECGSLSAVSDLFVDLPDLSEALDRYSGDAVMSASEVLSFYGKIFEKSQSATHAHYLGVTHRKRGDWGDAMHYFGLAMTLDPSDPEYALLFRKAARAAKRAGSPA